MLPTVRQPSETAYNQPSAVRRANCVLLIFILLAGSIFTLFATALGLSEEVAFCLDAVIVLVALQLLLKGTADSPFAVLRRYREISLFTAVRLATLVYVINAGLLTFISAFMPRLYNAFAGYEYATSAAWELPFSILGFVILAPFYEELVFRGVALKAYRDARSTLFAVLFTSALFGFVHGSLVHAFVIFPSAILFALVVLQTGQLWTAIAVHALGNLTATLLIQFDTASSTIVATPLSEGVIGLIVAAIAFGIGFHWLRLPQTEYRREGSARKNIWTTSLVIALMIIVLFNVLTTYGALGTSVEVGL